MYKNENEINYFSAKDLKVNNINLTINSLVRKFECDEIDLNPKFRQEVELWSREKMSRFIESILLRLPLPILYFDVSNPDRWSIVDGRQRLYTIKEFIHEPKSFPLSDLEFLKSFNGKYYNDLDNASKRLLHETSLIIYQIEAQTPKKLRNAIYKRVNSGVMK